MKKNIKNVPRDFNNLKNMPMVIEGINTFLQPLFEASDDDDDAEKESEKEDALQDD
jgi:hypothetical protein